MRAAHHIVARVNPPGRGGYSFRKAPGPALGGDCAVRGNPRRPVADGLRVHACRFHRRLDPALRVRDFGKFFARGEFCVLHEPVGKQLVLGGRLAPEFARKFLRKIVFGKLNPEKLADKFGGRTAYYGAFRSGGQSGRKRKRP